LNQTQVETTANLLTAKIVARQGDVKKFNDYYRGKEGRLRFASDEFKEYFTKRFDGFSDNWCAVVADTTVERIEYLGMRLDGKRKADATLERAWERGEAKRKLGEAILMMNIAKRAYGLVWPDGRITFENPDSAAILTNHRTGKTGAGLLLAQDDKFEYGQLFIPAARSGVEVIELQREKLALENGERRIAPDANAWQFSNKPIKRLKFDAVPLVEMSNKALLDNDPISDIEGVASAQDAINLVWAYTLNALDYLSLPGRVVMNGEKPVEEILDEDGNVIGSRPAELDALIRDRISWLEGEGLSISEWSAGSVDGFAKIIELAVAHVAAQTRTPAHYLLSTGSNTPATGYDLAEAGLVSKVKERMTYVAPAIKELNRLVAIAGGDTKKAEQIATGKVLWASPQYRSEAQLVDALVKLRQIGFPLEFIAEQYGLEPKEVKRVMKMIADEQSETEIVNFKQI